jgi:Protein of unknown function (DUF3352)
MSSDLPPTGPPPPLGPRPSGPPPEFLQQGAGQPLPSPPGSGVSGRRKVVIAAGAVVGVAAATAAVFGAMWYFGTGPQPAEALPDSTIAYVSIDIDPSGKQLLEAKDVLEKFPAWTDEKISSRKDLREAVFDEVLADAPCDLDYNDDVEPWLGDRAAAALVDLGEDRVPVVVVQVKDADKAEDAFAKFNDCDPGGGETAGWAISGEWAVLAESEDIATQVAEDAQDHPLSKDDDYQKWTDEVGEPGILNAYLAPEAGDWLAKYGMDYLDMGMSFGLDACALGPEMLDRDDEGVDPYDPSTDDPDCGDTPAEVPDEVKEILDDFSGAAMTVRFDDGGLEVETASSTDVFGADAISTSDNAGESIETLPDDTAAAIAVGFEQGWFADYLDSMQTFAGTDIDVDELIAEAEDELGLDLPDDAETLAGDSAVIAVGGDFDPGDFVGSDVDITQLPIGVKIKGDADAIQDVIDKILDGQDLSEGADELFVSDSEGDFVAIGPNEDYREQLLDHGRLGDSDAYRDVVRESDDAASVFYVNFDAGGGWLEDLFDGDEEFQDNLAPLEAAGMSTWEDDGVGHAVLRITTE